MFVRAWIVVIAALASTQIIAAPPPPDVPLEESGRALDSLAVSLLAATIVESRDAAAAEGVHAIPRAVRAALRDYVPEQVLDRARWRVGGGGWLSLQRNLIGFGYTPAVTLDHVVVFETASDVRDPKLWVHELRHVEQFMHWGVAGFAARYIANYEALEIDAAEYRWSWMKLTGRTPKP